MISSLLQQFALRLRPEINKLTSTARAGALLNVYNIIFTTPLGVLGLLWLATEMDVSVIRENGFIFLILFIIAFVVNFNWFELQVELRPGVFATSSGTMMFLITTSAVFIFGPTAYWINVLVNVSSFILASIRDPYSSSRWNRLGTLTTGVATGTLATLTGTWAYRALGGTFPLANITATTIWPIVAFLLIDWLLPFTFMSPLVIYITRTPDFLGNERLNGKTILMFLFVNSSIPNLGVPFTALGAVIYTLNGAPIYFFYLTGIILVSYLASNLTKNVNDRDQRARELGILEKIGRQIIIAPPDASTLPDILQDQVPAMFFRARTLIWLEPDRVIYTDPDTTYPELGLIQERLTEGDSAPYQLIPPRTLTEDRLLDAVVLPIQSDDGDCLGGLYFSVNRDFGKVREFIPALQALAAQISSALNRAETHKETLLKQRMENELKLAGRIQANFLPEKIPALPGYEIAASLTPALQTSGDFYDFIPYPDGRLGFVVADVADKGTGAALFMALTRTLLRTYVLEYPDDPALAFKLTNDRVHEDTQSQLFITTFFGIINPQQHTLAYVNGGHNPPFLFDPNNGNHPQGFIRTGVPIGMLDEATWKAVQVPFPPDHFLVLYTDGVTEAQNDSQELFDEERLIESGMTHSNSPAEEIHAGILKTIQAFVAGAPQFDDITLMVIRRTS